MELCPYTISNTAQTQPHNAQHSLHVVIIKYHPKRNDLLLPFGEAKCDDQQHTRAHYQALVLAYVSLEATRVAIVRFDSVQPNAQ